MGKLSNNTTALKPTSKKSNVSAGTSPIKAKSKKGLVANKDGGGVAKELKAKSELFLTAISTLAGEDTYYESGDARIKRVTDLTHKIAGKDPEWLQRFIPWLRGSEVNLRTISLIIAAEYVAAEAPDGAKVIESVCQRADEPAEILAYWMQKHYGWNGRSYPLPSPKLPQALRKGLARATASLYNEYAVLKYDGNSRGVSMANVINLVHPAPNHYPKDWDEDRINQQRAIYKYIIDKAYGNELDLNLLPTIKANLDIRKLDRDQLIKLSTPKLREAGVTWEQFGGLLQGPWTKKAWENIIPTMGYMALIRNLRNFEGARISTEVRNSVIKKLSDPEQVAKSRQLPFRFLSAHRNVNSSAYLQAIEDGLDASVQNIPAFTGKTLVLVDKSGSMDHPLSEKSSVARWEVGALFATALTLKGENVDLYIFGDTHKKMNIPKGSSVLQGIKKLNNNQGVGHGTNIWGTIKSTYSDHDRVVVFTDVQDNWNSHSYSYYGNAYSEATFNDIPFIHYFDIGGYGQGGLELGKPGRFQYGGFSDATFKLMALLEEQTTGWPF